MSALPASLSSGRADVGPDPSAWSSSRPRAGLEADGATDTEVTADADAATESGAAESEATDAEPDATASGRAAGGGVNDAAGRPPGSEADRRDFTGVIAGVIAGVMVVAALLISGRIVAPLRFSERDATDEFISAWRRSRSGTFVVDSEWQRVKDNGDVLTSASRLVQAPPNRVTRQVGGINAEIEGRRVDCFTHPDGTFACNEGIPLNRTFEEGVQKELDDLRDHFRLTDPGIYRVRTDEHGCFELVQTRPYPNPTFGRLAQVCFDDETGAMRYSERRFEGVKEILRAESIRAQVVPADFDLTQKDEFAERLPPTSSTTVSVPSTTGGR